MCTWVRNALRNVPSYPITMRVTMTAHSQDITGDTQPDQTWSKGGTDAETWFLASLDGQPWRATLADLGLANVCPTPD